MDETKGPTKRVAVVGGGITGLAAAHRLTELSQERHCATDVTLFEAGDRPGGVLQTERHDGYCVELGPDSMLTQVPWGLDLCRRIGFEDQLIGTNDAHRQTYIVRGGRLLRLPEGLAIMAPSRIWPTVRSPILSAVGKARLACEVFIPQRGDSGDESLADFARRRFGRETFERLVQPLVSGIYMADPELLSMRAALPRFVAMEAKHSSLIRAARRAVREKAKSAASSAASSAAAADNSADSPGDSAAEASGPRYSMFVAPREGLGSLAAALADRLPSGVLRLRTRVEQLERQENGRWRLHLSRPATGSVTGTSSGSTTDSATDSATDSPSAQRTGHGRAHGPGPRTEEFDAVIVAAPSQHAAHLLGPVDRSLATDLATIQHAGCAVVIAAYAREQVGHPLDGFGFVVPQVERRDIIACTFSSVKYAGRAPTGDVLFRVFMGGATRPDLLEKEDSELLSIAARELRDLAGVRDDAKWARVARWPNIMPQYHVGHLALVDRIETTVASLPGLELAGNSYRGVGIPHCIHSGEQAAERVVASDRRVGG